MQQLSYSFPKAAPAGRPRNGHGTVLLTAQSLYLYSTVCVLTIDSILLDTSAESTRNCSGMPCPLRFSYRKRLVRQHSVLGAVPPHQHRVPHDQSSGHEIHMTNDRIQVVMPSW